MKVCLGKWILARSPLIGQRVTWMAVDRLSNEATFVVDEGRLVA